MKTEIINYNLKANNHIFNVMKLNHKIYLSIYIVDFMKKIDNYDYSLYKKK